MQCETIVCKVVLGHVFPLCGMLTNLFILLAPWKVVQQTLKTKQTGTISTIPYVFLMMNSLTWVIYGFAIKDYYVTIPNLQGYLIANYYNFTTFPYLSESRQYLTINLILSFLSLIFIGGIVDFIVFNNDTTGRLILGSICLFILSLFYLSPLSEILNIIRTKNCASINPKLAFAVVINSALWCSYGSLLGDWFIIGPNGFGFLLGLFQVFLLIVYPSTLEKEAMPINADLELKGSASGDTQSIDPLETEHHREDMIISINK
ncbi:sugar efflux transporter for intercellular exchange-domain-containing protein [Globomyces pollinis-pini]|nr:sugar efflux transporter for intercellular exchange-domain-containing protein [Globomyces pollinis-pini]